MPSLRRPGDVFIRHVVQPLTANADPQMEAMTQELIDAAIECGGVTTSPIDCTLRGISSFKADRQALKFFERKCYYDPTAVSESVLLEVCKSCGISIVEDVTDLISSEGHSI